MKYPRLTNTNFNDGRAGNLSQAARFSLLALLALLVLLPGCQRNDQFEVVVLKSKVKQLETRVAELQNEIGQASERKALKADVVRLQGELIESQQLMTTLRSRVVSLEVTSVLPPPPTREEIEASISSLQSAGADIEQDAEGNVIAVRATEFPLELDVIEELRNFRKIKRVAVSGPWVTHEMFDVFGSLATLERLDAELTIADGQALEKIAHLPNLTFLHLFRTDIDDDSMKVLGSMPALQQIRCGQTRVGDEGLAHLVNLKTLVAIDLSDCNRVSGRGVEYLSGLPNLKFLKVWGPQISDDSMEFIARMKSLEVLGLNDTMVTDRGIEKLKSLTRLKEVHLVRTRIGDVALKILSQMPEIRTLRLRDTQLTDKGLSYLVQLKKLAKLDLSENQSPGITDAGLESLAEIESLQELNLWTTPITNSGVETLQSLTNLVWLNLDKTRITDGACKSLESMTQLTWLHVGSNKLTDAAISSLIKLENLKYLNLSHTEISQDGFFQLDDELAPRGGVVIQP